MIYDKESSASVYNVEKYFFQFSRFSSECLFIEI